VAGRPEHLPRRVEDWLKLEARREFEAILTRQDKATKHLRDAMDSVRERYKTMMKDVPMSDWNTPENSAKWQKLYQELRGSAEYKKNMAEYETLKKDLQKYVDAAPSGADAPARAHGYVWLFRRK